MKPFKRFIIEGSESRKEFLSAVEDWVNGERDLEKRKEIGKRLFTSPIPKCLVTGITVYRAISLKNKQYDTLVNQGKPITLDNLGASSYGDLELARAFSEYLNPYVIIFKKHLTSEKAISLLKIKAIMTKEEKEEFALIGSEYENDDEYIVKDTPNLLKINPKDLVPE